MRETGEMACVNVCVIAVVCDKCGKRITPDEWIEWQEIFRFSGCGGYGSKFGDLCPFTLDLCEDCWHGLVGSLVKYQVQDKIYKDNPDGSGCIPTGRDHKK